MCLDNLTKTGKTSGTGWKVVKEIDNKYSWKVVK